MNQTDPTSSSTSASGVRITDQLWQRILLIIGGFMVFVLLASVFMPDSSSGDLTPTIEPIPRLAPNDAAINGGETTNDAGAVNTHSPPTDAIGDVAAADLPLICTIESRSYQVSVFATDAGPRYTVFGRDEMDSAPLADLITSSELNASFPELRDMTVALGLGNGASSDRQQLMMVDPNRRH